MDNNLKYWFSCGFILKLSIMILYLSCSIDCQTAISVDNSTDISKKPIVTLESEPKSNKEIIEESWPINKSRNISLYIRPFDNTTIIEPIKRCNSSQTFLNIIVISAIKHRKKRLAIRQTWGSQNEINNKSIVINFLIGQTDDNYLTKKIRKEADEYGDIIQESFHDSYYNLTIKSGMMLKWFIKHCPGTRFLMKCDDDMYVNIENLLKSTSGNEKLKRNFLLGHFGSSYIDKDPQSKWYMPEYIFDGARYPPYTTGPSYVMTRQVAKKIYNESLLINFFHLEDVFYTGICAGKANVTLVNDDNFQREDYSRKMITKHDVHVKKMIRMWNK